jgi:ERCC4-type nuclease
MEIIIDDREKAVIPYMDEVADKYNITYKLQRCTVGDYAITYKNTILLTIERKTWADLAASMRDGRKENIKKLFELQDKTNCQLAYLIEGDATPDFNAKICRLPYKNLRAHLDHLAFRDGIHMIYSANERYTAERLCELAINYMSLKDMIADLDIKSGNEKALQEKTNTEISIDEQLLRCIPKVGSVVSALLAENNITFRDIYDGKYDVTDISVLKYPSGAMLGEKAKSICRLSKIINSEKHINTHKKILTTIPLITKKTATIILEHYSLGDIINGAIDIADVADIKKTEKTRLGQKAANNIFKYLQINMQ